MRMDIADVVQIISSVATTIAVIVSLWQSGYQNQKKIKSDVCMLAETSTEDCEKKKVDKFLNFRIDMTNVGRYDIAIKKILLVRNHKESWPLNFFESEINYELSDYPIYLKVGEYERIRVFSHINEIGKVMPSDKVILLDSSNKKYRCKRV